MAERTHEVKPTFTDSTAGLRTARLLRLRLLACLVEAGGTLDLDPHRIADELIEVIQGLEHRDHANLDIIEVEVFGLVSALVLSITETGRTYLVNAPKPEERIEPLNLSLDRAFTWETFEAAYNYELERS